MTAPAEGTGAWEAAVTAPVPLSAEEEQGTEAEGTEAEAALVRLPLRLPSLDTDCLLLSNQAKLEAKLEANHVASGSKLAPGVAYSYHTPTQQCEVGNDGTTCIDYTIIGRNAFIDTQLTGTLKVGRSVTLIDTFAFQSTKLTGLDLSEATALTTIGYAAFADTALMGQEECTPNKCFTLM